MSTPTSLGDFVDRVAECEIQFTFGTFKAKERKVKFEFDQNRLSQVFDEVRRDL
jgi:hypothetical protein